MSQTIDWNVPTVGPATPTEMATRTSDSLDALLSKHSGSARPPYAVAGTEWADTSVAGTLQVKLFDGAADRLLYSVDLTTGLITLPSPQILLKQSATPGPTAEGDLQWDTDDNAMVVGDGAGQKVFRANDWEKVAKLSPSGVSQVAQSNLGLFQTLRLSGWLIMNADGAVRVQVSDDGGATWKSTAETSVHLVGSAGAGAPDANYNTNGYGFLTMGGKAGQISHFDMLFHRFNDAAAKELAGISGGVFPSGAVATYMSTSHFQGGHAVAANAFRLVAAAGSFTNGRVYIEGIRT